MVTATRTIRSLRLPKQGRFRDLDTSGLDARLVEAFGPPIYTPEMQQDRPDQPLTRLVKDVLRVGVWSTDSGRWVVTQEDLNAIAAGNNLALDRGRLFNLVKTHGDARSGVVHPDDIIAPIDGYKVIGDTLWIDLYVTPQDAEYLKKPGRDVSVRSAENFEDNGDVYPQILLHVAVVDLPVIPGQGPFRQLSRNLALNGGSVMDFAALLAAINMILGAVGLNPLGDDTTEENITPRLEGLAAGIGGVPAPEPTPAEPPADPALEPPVEVPADVPAEMSKGFRQLSAMIAQQNATIRNLSNTVTSLQSDRARQAKEQYETQLSAMCQNGLPAVERTRLLALGAKFNYDLSLLPTGTAGYIDLSKKGRQGAVATPPARQGGRRTDAEIKASLEADGITPVNGKVRSF